jgi:lipopolysaccharide export system protein LptA
VHIYQDDKSIKGEGATFDRKKERLVLKKNVEITLSELNWLIQKKKGESFKNERLVETLNNECHIKSDYLMINLKKKHLLLKGNVTIKQGNQEARAEVLIYNDKKNQIVLLGKTDDLVYYKKESGEVIRTRKLTADVEREEYWSDEQTTIEFDYEDGGLVF